MPSHDHELHGDLPERPQPGQGYRRDQKDVGGTTRLTVPHIDANAIGPADVLQINTLAGPFLFPHNPSEEKNHVYAGFICKNDRQTQIDFIRTTGWGYLTGVIDDERGVTHLPFLVAGGTGEEKLVAHMARANPHWRSFTGGKPQLVVFPGPHTYITPSWYNTDKAVPTWNYTTAHVYGAPVVIDDPQTVYAGHSKTL